MSTNTINKRNSEMAIFTKAKELISLTFNLSENWPKKYRFDFTSRVRNISMDIYESLLEANEIYIDTKILDVKKSLNPDNLIPCQNINSGMWMMAVNLFKIYKMEEYIAKRREKQNQAFAGLKKLDYLFSEAYSLRLINAKKWERVSGLISETIRLLKAWVKSDHKRFEI